MIRAYHYITCVCCILLLLSCKSEKLKYREEIAVLQEAWEMRRDSDTAKMLVLKYYDYQLKYPDDTISASYVRRAAVIHETEQNFSEAIIAMELIIEKYPKYRKITKTYSDLGRMYEIIGDYENARRIYEEFLAKYPDDGEAANILYSLENLGLPPSRIKQNLLETPDSLEGEK